MPTPSKLPGTLIEYLDQGRFRPAWVFREQERHLAVLDGQGHERLIPRDLVMAHHPDRRVPRESAGEAIETLAGERVELAREVDLNLLWEVVQEQGRSFTAPDLAELFFGRRSHLAASVLLEALLDDRVYFVRRHLEFAARTPEQVERLRVQQDRVRSKSDDYRRTQQLLRDIINHSAAPTPEESAALIDQLTLYLKNPFTRNRELTQMLESAGPEVDPAEVAFEVLDRLGNRPAVPRFAFIAGLRTTFDDQARAEVATIHPPSRTLTDGGYSITIDDEDTVEVDDAISCELEPGGNLRVRVHIALVADFVPRGGAIDREAAARATTVYLPETTVRMLPDEISCSMASLLAGEERPVLTTEVTVSPTGELLATKIYPARIRIRQRLSYDEADRLLSASDGGEAAASLRLLDTAAKQLRERRARAGAAMIRRREVKVRVVDGQIDITVLDSDSPSRALVAECMLLSNYVAARHAAEHKVPIIFRVQPDSRSDVMTQKPRLSLYPESHAGIGLDYYAQLSSPIRRYADLVLQHQLVAALESGSAPPYRDDELLTVLANAESAEASGRELERRAKRYWVLRHLESTAVGTPLTAFATREGASAELTDYVMRGTLRGAPILPDFAPITVRIARVDPLRGWLSFDYVGPAERVAEQRE